MKSKGHIYMANLMIELIQNPAAQIDFPGIPNNNYKVPPLVKDSILKYPSYFRAGAVGPDFFPDLIFGQAIIHPKGSGKWLEIMYDELLQIPPETEQQWQAISFYAGYMMHYAGDMYTHDYINSYAGGWFPDLTGIKEKLSSTNPRDIEAGIKQVLIIVRHVAVEKYLDDYIEEQAARNKVHLEKTLDIPVDFLRRCFASKAALFRLGEVEKDYGIDLEYNFLKKYVMYLNDLYTDKGKSMSALKERDAYIDSWLKLWKEIAYDSLRDGTFDALDRYKIEIARHCIAFYYKNEKERRKKEELLDTVNNIVGILDIDIYIPILSDLMDMLKNLIKDKLKSVAYPYIVDAAALISGKPKEELKDFDSAVEAVKKRFVNVEVLLRDPQIFPENKKGDLPSALRSEWSGMGASYDLKKINFAAFNNACKMGYLCLLGPDELNRLMLKYDKSLGGYYRNSETSIGISNIILSINTGGGRYDGTNKNLIVKICGEKTGERENVLDQFTVSGAQYLQKNSTVRLKLPTSYTIPLSKIDHFLLKLDGNNLWNSNYISFFDGSTNIELTEWSGRMRKRDEVRLPVRRDVAYHYETVSYSAKISTLAIEIKTSGKRWSGTDNDVYFTVYANGGSYVQSKLLDKSGYNDFEAGDRDTYTMKLNVPKTYNEIDYFVLSKKGSDDWRVESVMVYDLESNECISVCSVNRLVGSSGEKIEKGIHLQPMDDGDESGSAPIQEAPKEQMISQMIVTIKTANKLFAGTDNDVFFKAIYLDDKNKENSIRVSLDTSWHNDFERGDTDTFRVAFKTPVSRKKLSRFELNKKGSDDWTIDWVKVQDATTGACLGKHDKRRELRKETDVITMPAQQ